MEDETRKLLNNVVRKIRDNSSRPAKIGRQDKTLYFTDATGKTYRDKVWVRVGTGNGSMEMVARLGAPVPVIYNLPVRVEEVRGVLTITETDGSLASTFAGYRPIGAGMHAWQHGRIGVDALSIEGLQFEPLLVVPTNPPTMTVGVNAGRYKYGGTRKTFETTTSADLSGYVPAASQTQHFIIVCLDRTNNALAIVDGSSVSGTDVYTDYSKMVIPFTDADIDAISINDDYLPLAAVRFYYGQTAILPADIFKDLRYWGGEIGDYAAGTHTHTEADITDLSHDAVSIRGIAVSEVAPNDNQILVYDLGTNTLVFEDPAAGGAVDAADVSYTPADNTDWSGSADPGDVDSALDQLADRLTAEEAHDHDADYAPLVHTHVKADITDFNDADYADAVHTHVEADIIDLEHNAVKLQGIDISATPPSDNQALVYDSGSSSWLPKDLTATGDPSVCHGRLSLITNTPVYAQEVFSATTVYFVPYLGNLIGLYDGSNWQIVTFTQKSLAIPAVANRNYDIFAYDNAGNVNLYAVAWSSNTARATALALQDGIKVLSGDATKRYIGTIRTTGVAGRCEDSQRKRFVFNMYNRVEKSFSFVEYAPHTYTGTAIRPWNNNSSNIVEMVLGEVSTVSIWHGGQMEDQAAIDVTNVWPTSAGLLLDYVVKTTEAVSAVANGLIDEEAGYRYLMPVEMSKNGTTGTFTSVSLTAKVLM